MAQLVEQRIRNAWVAGSSPAIGSLPMESGFRDSDSFLLKVHCIFIKAELAQLVEHWLPKPRVAGSSPVFRSKRKNRVLVKKVLEMAETSSLLNCRTGSRTGGSNPPPSAPRGFLCESN